MFCNHYEGKVKLYSLRSTPQELSPDEQIIKLLAAIPFCKQQRILVPNSKFRWLLVFLSAAHVNAGEAAKH